MFRTPRTLENVYAGWCSILSAFLVLSFLFLFFRSSIVSLFLCAWLLGVGVLCVSYHLCVFFTLNRSFYPSTSSKRRVRADSSSYS